MNQQAIVETILTNSLKKIGTDVGELLGQELTFGDTGFERVDKSAYFFDNPRGKSLLTGLTVSGDQEGTAYLVMPVAAAIQLGGTLIMLPEDSIAEKVQSEEIGPDETDAFSEIANILTGSLSRTFESQYSKKLHLAKGETEELIPTKVDAEADTPFPPGDYLLCSAEIKLEGNSLGPLDLIFASALLGLEGEAPAGDEAAEAPSDVPETDSVDASPSTTPEESSEEAPAPVTDTTPAVEEEATPAAEAETSGPSPEEVKRNKSVVDLVLKSAVQKVDAELGALMGEFVATADCRLQMLTKEKFFFDQPRDTLILSHMDVSGDQEGKAYLITEAKDATYLGGTLIMLPEDEIQASIDAGEFDGEAADAYGEIANILAGVVSTTFESKHPKKYHFVRKETESVQPTMVDPNGDEPFPPGDYYVCSFGLTVGEKELGQMDFVFPAEVLGISPASLETPKPKASTGPGAAQVDATATRAAGGADAVDASAGSGSGAGVDTVDAAAGGSASTDVKPKTPAILIVSDAGDQGTFFKDSLGTLGYETVVCGFQDDLKALLSQYQVVLIYLLMSQVNEQGFAAAIKIQSAASPMPPMVAGGPEWTRSTVLRAVRYGVQDILITPAAAEEVLEKAQGQLQQKAAG